MSYAVIKEAEARPALTPEHPAWAGQALYTRRNLQFYDAFVLGFSARFLWRCPAPRLLAMYHTFASARHLDVGVGTGYYLDRCRFPIASPDLTLLDANSGSLSAAARRIARYAPKTLQASVLDPIALPAQSFASIGLTFVLHCLPGPFAAKAVAFEHLAPLLSAGGVLFGATVLGRGVPINPLARQALRLYNRRGIFSNTQDDPEALERALSRSFARHEIELVGSVAMFRGYSPGGTP